MIKAVKREFDLNRQHSMTTREFERAMEGIGVKGQNVRRLTRLFEKVRYGARDLDIPEEQEAIDCLNSIIKDCERPR